MTVYVDDMYRLALGEFGRMKMSHMIADTTEELLAMAKKIGVKHKWIQDAGTYSEHFDIAKSKRELAIEYGAKPITFMEFGRILNAREPLPSGIYAIICRKDKRRYIGSAVKLGERKLEHFRALEAGTHGNRKLQAAWHKLGKEQFYFKVLKRCPVDRLLKWEQRYIEKYDAVNTGFNIAPEAGKVTFGKAFHLRSRRKKQGKNRHH